MSEPHGHQRPSGPPAPAGGRCGARGRHADAGRSLPRTLHRGAARRGVRRQQDFVDCAPRIEPEAILAAYRAQRARPGFDLRGLRARALRAAASRSPKRLCLGARANRSARTSTTCGSVLTRHPQDHPPRGSLLPLPHPYVVPGGRFAELYYWDSYFTMLGLAESGQAALVHDMIDNFAYLIDTYGHRAQRQPHLLPEPLAAAGVRADGRAVRGSAAGRVRGTFCRSCCASTRSGWTAPSDLRPGQAHRRVVRAARRRAAQPLLGRARHAARGVVARGRDDGAQSQRPRPAEIYRDMRAAAESGWDFSTRWLRESSDGDARRACRWRASAPPTSCRWTSTPSSTSWRRRSPR